MIFFLKLALCSTFLLSVFNSCRSDSECESCLTSADGIKKLFFIKDEIKFDYWDDRNQSKGIYRFFHSQTSADQINNLLKSTGVQNFKIKNSTITNIVFYTNSIFENNENIDIESIEAIQFNYSIDNLLKSYFLIKRDSIFYREKLLESRLSNISTNDMFFFSSKLNVKEHGIFVFVNANKNNLFESEDGSNLKSNITNYFSKSDNSKRGDVDEFTTGEDLCSTPCRVSAGEICSLVGHQYKCGNSENCSAKKIINITKDSKVKRNFDLNDLYEIKNFALKFKIGKKYVNNYYTLSNYYKNSISISEGIKLIELGNEIIPQIPILINGKNRKFISEDLANKIYANILYFKNQSNDDGVNLILDEIISDLSIYKNKTGKEIIKNLK